MLFFLLAWTMGQNSAQQAFFREPQARFFMLPSERNGPAFAVLTEKYVVLQFLEGSDM